MPLLDSDFVELHRRFAPIGKDEEPNLEAGLPWGFGVGKWLDWSDLLRHRRVVLLAEAASGKTWEFRHRAEALAAEGKPAFFVRIEDLVDGDFESALDPKDAALIDPLSLPENKTRQAALSEEKPKVAPEKLLVTQLVSLDRDQRRTLLAEAWKDPGRWIRPKTASSKNPTGLATLGEVFR
uniref:Uncharacterized protein n=1 Tax=Candidatus Kentrum sp. TC TaxID=2126339 RepID=A0A450YR51_9GAMM|nr:MAG: hypothetical protein BECKTC1821D_GA0114238_101934 [Candidatus Kentron sp. TC]